jgi:hypothetical protein
MLFILAWQSLLILKISPFNGRLGRRLLDVWGGTLRFYGSHLGKLAVN